MFNPQSSLGAPSLHSYPRFDTVRVARVTGTTDWKLGKIEVMFNDGISPGGVPVPVALIENGLNIEPCEGDWVLVGYINGKKNSPYFIGFYANKYALANRISVTKEEIKLEFPTEEGSFLIKMDATGISIG